MKKSGVSTVLVLLVTVFGVLAARSVARAPDLGNFLLRSQNSEKDQQVAGSNILVTGQTLGPGERLAYGNYFFEMQRSCNLVLYNIRTGEVLFSSNTAITYEPNCTLSFDDYGRLSIHSTIKGEQFTIFTIPKEKSEGGDYIAVLRPDGMVAIYGPRVFSATPQVEKMMNKGDDIYESTGPSLGSVLFSGQALQNGQMLRSHNGKTKFILKKGELALISEGKKKWRSGNDLCAGRETTFAPLEFNGQLFIFDNILRPVCWVSSPPKVTGEYVLAAQDDGIAAIYGPKVATIPVLESSLEGIRMVINE